LTFLGAAGEVTGSQHLIETRDRRILLDCGLVQGKRAEARARNQRLRCEPADLDGVILSHGHIDHCGNLPTLYRAGYRGPIFCTEPTADIAEIMLEDSAKIQAEDARYLNKHRPPGTPPITPLYRRQDVKGVAELLEPLPYDEWHELARDVRLRFSDAGHILGSAIVEIELEDRGDRRRVVFTGDLGRRGMPLLRDPAAVGGCDVLITESTYGNQIHPSADDIKAELLRVAREAVTRGGKVIIPAFSLGRTQQIVYFLNVLYNEGTLPAIPVFVDSPLSRRVTRVYRRHGDVLNANVQKTLRTDADAFGFPTLTYVASRKESKELNDLPPPAVIISASGMCENGRVLHHLAHTVEDERNTIVIVGYQAQHTLGRRIVERHPQLRILDRWYELRARVEILNGLSAHADALDFKWWFEQLASQTGIGTAFVVHGEPKAAASLASILRDYCDEPPIIPELYDSYDV
ncbi:MAG: MBL fold metallo-hydrolase, partial [Planctomycetes bacterium]|nr:MBL fold metallo-hydrolase [Planctomycetota bacterium]